MYLYAKRLTLQVPGLSESDGARLARLIAERLTLASNPQASVSKPESSVNLIARENETVESLADRIVAEIVCSLVGSP